MAYKPYTWALSAGQGGMITFPTPVTGFTLVAEAECWVQPLGAQPNGTTPALPTQSPAPQANTVVAGWQHLRANDSITVGYDGGAGPPGDIVYLQIWAIGSGYLQIVPTRF